MCAGINLVYAQQRIVNEVKKEISGLTLTIDSYKNSLKKRFGWPQADQQKNPPDR